MRHAERRPTRGVGLRGRAGGEGCGRLRRRRGRRLRCTVDTRGADRVRTQLLELLLSFGSGSSPMLRSREWPVPERVRGRAMSQGYLLSAFYPRQGHELLLHMSHAPVRVTQTTWHSDYRLLQVTKTRGSHPAPPSTSSLPAPLLSIRCLLIGLRWRPSPTVLPGACSPQSVCQLKVSLRDQGGQRNIEGPLSLGSLVGYLCCVLAAPGCLPM